VKEYIVDLWPITTGLKTGARLFAPNAAAAIALAKKLYANYRPGNPREVGNKS
jgi:hypothetical protein